MAAKKLHTDWYNPLPEGLEVWVNEDKDGNVTYSTREDSINERYVELSDLVFAWKSINTQPVQATEDTGVNATTKGSKVPESTTSNAADSGDGGK